MENTEIIYKCNCLNNKNVRANELNYMKIYEDKLYFEFGEDDKNIKKRIYKDLQTLREDYNNILKIKEELSKAPKEEVVVKEVNEEEFREFEEELRKAIKSEEEKPIDFKIKEKKNSSRKKKIQGGD